MKDKTEKQSNAINDLVELQQLIQDVQENLKTEIGAESLKSVKKLINEFKEANNIKDKNACIQGGYIEAKKFQLALIDFMLVNLNKIKNSIQNTSEKQTSHHKPLEPNSNNLLNNCIGMGQKALSNFIDTSSTFISTAATTLGLKEDSQEDVTFFIHGLTKARNKLNQSAANQGFKLASFKAWIHEYQQFLDNYYPDTNPLNNYYPKVELSKELQLQLKTEKETQETSGLKKTKLKAVQAKILSREEYLASLKRQLSQLESESESYSNSIEEAKSAYNAKNCGLTQQAKDDQQIVMQIALLKTIVDTSIPNLLTSKKQTINEIEFLLKAQYHAGAFSFTNEEEQEKHTKKFEMLKKQYLQPHHMLSEEMLYEMLIQQYQEYIPQLRYITEKFCNASTLFINRIDEIDAARLLSLQADLIDNLAQTFKKKEEELVAQDPKVKALLSLYPPLLEKCREVITQRNKIETQLTTQDIHLEPEYQLETPRIQKRMEVTKSAYVELSQKQKQLTKLLATLDVEMNIANQNRNGYSSSAKFLIKEKVDQLTNLVQCNEPILNEYGIKESITINNLLTDAEKLINNLSTLTLEKMQESVPSMLKRLTDFITSLSNKINEVNSFTVEINEYQQQLQELANQRTEFPLNQIYDRDTLDLNAINYLILDQKTNYNSNNLAMIAQRINVVRSGQELLKDKYLQRAKTVEIKYLDELIAAASDLTNDNKWEWANALVDTLQTIRTSYLTSKTNLQEFKDSAEKALTTHITEKNLSQMTINNENKYSIGNFFRAAVEFIVALWRSRKQDEKPLYQIKFFASDEEKKFASNINQTYKLLMDVQEEQCSKKELSPQAGLV